MIRLASLSSNSSVDGPGLRTVVWFQGCPHHCVGCHNPQTQSIDLGYCVELDILLNQIIELNNKKITLSGGEPFLQSLALLDLVERLDCLGYDIWCYTGYTFEECLNNPVFTSILRHIHFLVDGKFMLDQMDHSLMFRGSKNQRVIDVRQYFELRRINNQKSWSFVD
jgi:anaerobic ribonucleoside-triphosphate reductase activating protein